MVNCIFVHLFVFVCVWGGGVKLLKQVLQTITYAKAGVSSYSSTAQAHGKMIMIIHLRKKASEKTQCSNREAQNS